jgi:hypothetical protein
VPSSRATPPPGQSGKANIQHYGYHVKIDHITYHVSPDTIRGASLVKLLDLIGLGEVRPDDPFEHGYDVRWFAPSHMLKPWVHVVADGEGTDRLRLGHFCAVLAPDKFAKAAESEFCVRDSGSGRIWLGLDNLRIEVRPA